VNVNRLPIITTQANLETTVGQTANASFSALDPDGDDVIFSGINLPGNMTVTNNGDNSADIEYTPSEAEVGSTTVIINADDGNQVFSIPLNVIVNALPDDGRCSVSHTGSSTSTAFWTLLVGALLLRRRNKK
jgi:MYXO-CTERM domain-containing protein